MRNAWRRSAGGGRGGGRDGGEVVLIAMAVAVSRRRGQCRGDQRQAGDVRSPLVQTWNSLMHENIVFDQNETMMNGWVVFTGQIA